MVTSGDTSLDDQAPLRLGEDSDDNCSGKMTLDSEKDGVVGPADSPEAASSPKRSSVSVDESFETANDSFGSVEAEESQDGELMETESAVTEDQQHDEQGSTNDAQAEHVKRSQDSLENGDESINQDDVFNDQEKESTESSDQDDTIEDQGKESAESLDQDEDTIKSKDEATEESKEEAIEESNDEATNESKDREDSTGDETAEDAPADKAMEQDIRELMNEVETLIEDDLEREEEQEQKKDDEAILLSEDEDETTDIQLNSVKSKAEESDDAEAHVDRDRAAPVKRSASSESTDEPALGDDLPEAKRICKDEDVKTEAIKPEVKNEEAIKPEVKNEEAAKSETKSEEAATSEAMDETDTKDQERIEAEARVIKKVKKQVKRLTKEELEDLVARTVCEVMSGRSEIGTLRQRIDVLEDNVVRWRDKAQSLAKQVKDVATVVNKFAADTKAAKETGAWVEPVVITRSVGLQVGHGAATRLPSTSAFPSVAPTAGSSTSPVVISSQDGKRTRGQQAASVQNTRTATQTPPQQQPLVQPLTRRKVATATPISPAQNMSPSAVASAPTVMSRQNSNVDLVDLADDDDDVVAAPVATSRQVRMILPNNGVQNTSGRPITYVLQQHQPQARHGANGVRPVFMAVNNASGRSNVSFGQQQQASTTRFVLTPGGGRQVGVAGATGVVPRRLAPPPAHAQPTAQRRLLEKDAAQARAQDQQGQDRNRPVWTMPFEPLHHAEVATYQIYAYQDATGPSVLTAAAWKKVGDVRALPLPMACTLTQFLQGHTYNFAVRPVDVHTRVGSFSDPQSITLT